MPEAEQKAYIGKVRRARKALAKEINKLSKSRASYIAKKKPKTKGFDDTVKKALKKQGKSAGIKY